MRSCRTSTSLESLNISKSSKFTSKGVSRLTNLKTLISNDHITDIALHKLTKHHTLGLGTNNGKISKRKVIITPEPHVSS